MAQPCAQTKLFSVLSDLIQTSEPDPARVLVAGGDASALAALPELRSAADGRFAVDFVPEGLASVNPVSRVVETRGGRKLGYDALLLAMGPTVRSALPGALTYRGPQDDAAIAELRDAIARGEVRSVAFAVPRGARSPLPLYELARSTADWARANELNPRIELLTYERQPLGVLGPEVSKRERALLRAAGIRLRTSVSAVVAQPGRVFLAHGGAVAADRTVAIGRLVVDRIPGIPQGPGGFIPTDVLGRVEGVKRIYATPEIARVQPRG